jgi:hypothetical protein
VTAPRWRTGRKVGRTLYLDGVLVGLMDTRELAAQVVAALLAAESPGQSKAPPGTMHERG